MWYILGPDAEVRLEEVMGLTPVLLGQAPVTAGFWSMLAKIEPFGQLILLLLLLFMASALGLVVERIAYIARAGEESRRFLAIFRKSARFSEVKGACSELRRSPLVGLFLAASSELNYQIKAANPAPGGTQGTATAPSHAERPTIRSMDAISRALQRASSVEVAKLERGVAFLATTATV